MLRAQLTTSSLDHCNDIYVPNIVLTLFGRTLRKPILKHIIGVYRGTRPNCSIAPWNTIRLKEPSEQRLYGTTRTLHRQVFVGGMCWRRTQRTPLYHHQAARLAGFIDHMLALHTCSEQLPGRTCFEGGGKHTHTWQVRSYSPPWGNAAVGRTLSRARALSR